MVNGCRRCQRAHKPRTYGVIGVSDCRLPVPGAACGDIEIDGEMAKVLGRDVWAIFQRLVRNRVPPVKQGDARTQISQSDGEIDDTAFLFEDCSPTTDTGDMAVVPQDFVYRVVG